MTKPLIIVLPALARPLLEPHLPADVEVRWFTDAAQAKAMAAGAEIGWLDMQDRHAVADAIAAGAELKWVSTIYAGMDAFPLDLMRARGTVMTNGVGINTVAVAEYALLAMLSCAKALPEIVRAQDRREWLPDSPGKVELEESRALILGYGAIGRAIGDRLKAFGVNVTGVRRSPGGEQGVIGPDAWRQRLGEFDWIVLAAPATAETQAMIGAAELAAMKRDAWLINFARGTLVDQGALIETLRQRRIAGAFLDVVDPEPLPVDNPLWSLPNVTLSMHASGRAQTRMFLKSGTLFLDNLARYRAGQPLVNQVDLVLGY